MQTIPHRQSNPLLLLLQKDGSFTVTLTVTDSRIISSQHRHAQPGQSYLRLTSRSTKSEYFLGDVVNFIDLSTTKGSTTITAYKWNLPMKPNQAPTCATRPLNTTLQGHILSNSLITDWLHMASTATITKSVNAYRILHK